MDAFLTELTSEQYLKWAAFASKRGLPHYRQDVHYGIIASLIYNSNRGEKDAVEEPTAFMPFYDPLEEDLTVDDLRERLSVGKRK